MPVKTVNIVAKMVADAVFVNNRLTKKSIKVPEPKALNLTPHTG
jgi:hypothetical protein